MPARTPTSTSAASGTESLGSSRDNVIQFPKRRRARKSRDPSLGGADGAAIKVTVLPAARPVPPPPPPKPRARAEPDAYCSAGEACVAHPRLESPAKLSRHNRQEIDGNRYCYGCLSKIADERTRTIDLRQDSEASAASRHNHRPGQAPHRRSNEKRGESGAGQCARPENADRAVGAP